MMPELPSGSHTSDRVYLLQTSVSSSGTDSGDSVATNFRQRQTDVFASLANLEAAHKEVTKATRDERKAIQKATWRRVTAAPEDLVTEKELRERKHPTVPGVPEILQPAAEFRRPVAIPRPRAHHRQNRPVQRDPAKWTHYNLADVDEDGFGAVDAQGQATGRDSNFTIALSFLSELRQQRNSEDPKSEEEQTACGKGDRRILFQPKRGVKRARLQQTNESRTAEASTAVSGLIQNENEQEVQSILEESSIDRPDVSTFIHRRQRGRFRGREAEEESAFQHEMEDQCDNIQSSTTQDSSEISEVTCDDSELADPDEDEVLGIDAMDDFLA